MVHKYQAVNVSHRENVFPLLWESGNHSRNMVLEQIVPSHQSGRNTYTLIKVCMCVCPVSTGMKQHQLQFPRNLEECIMASTTVENLSSKAHFLNINMLWSIPPYTQKPLVFKTLLSALACTRVLQK